MSCCRRRVPSPTARQVEWDAGRIDEKLGITMKNSGDGLMEPRRVAGSKCWRTKQSDAWWQVCLP